MTFTAAFPNADLAHTRLEHPELFDGDDWVLPFRCYLARLGDANVLVDTGVGESSEFLPSGQRLLRERVDRDSIDLVVLTHLHVDHIGWAVRDGEPYFRRARYVASAADFAFFEDRLAEPADAGRLELVVGETEIAPDVRLLPTPGHTPGHMSVLLGESTLVLGDVAVHPSQLATPSLHYVHEHDPELAARTRLELFEWLAAEETVVAAGHFPLPFGRVREAGWGFRYEPV
jgi:glyoxylase-like metal-dependent hydrolase (beta-lactamase superfamily II)